MTYCFWCTSPHHFLPQCPEWRRIQEGHRWVMALWGGRWLYHRELPRRWRLDA